VGQAEDLIATRLLCGPDPLMYQKLDALRKRSETELPALRLERAVRVHLRLEVDGRKQLQNHQWFGEYESTRLPLPALRPGLNELKEIHSLDSSHTVDERLV
jgi:hypothetical protein